jgi:hypothetical protein
MPNCTSSMGRGPRPGTQVRDGTIKRCAAFLHHLTTGSDVSTNSASGDQRPTMSPNLTIVHLDLHLANWCARPLRPTVRSSKFALLNLTLSTTFNLHYTPPGGAIASDTECVLLFTPQSLGEPPVLYQDCSWPVKQIAAIRNISRRQLSQCRGCAALSSPVW